MILGLDPGVSGAYAILNGQPLSPWIICLHTKPSMAASLKSAARWTCIYSRRTSANTPSGTPTLSV